MWCHDSPNDSTDSQATLVDLSVVSKRRRPKKWQTELMLHVTWWSRKIRTAPPHSRPSKPAVREPPIR